MYKLSSKMTGTFPHLTEELLNENIMLHWHYNMLYKYI